jgi:hypothetical protein
MPTSCRGKASSGITLLELVTVTAIIGVMAALVFPSVSSGLDTIRLSSASDAVAAFLNGALNRAERRREVIEIVISVKQNSMRMYSSEPGFERSLELPEGVKVESVLPEADEAQDPRTFLVQPGGVAPRVGVGLVNRRGTRRIVRVDPMTGVPRIEMPEAP